MSSFPDRIKELLRLVGSPSSSVNARQGDRIFNFNYHPGEWTEFRKQLPVIKKQLRDKGFTPKELSFAEICLSIFKDSKIYQAQVKMEDMGTFPHSERNKALYSILSGAPADPLEPLKCWEEALFNFAANVGSAAQGRVSRKPPVKIVAVPD